jgi:hypothetical protein
MLYAALLFALSASQGRGHVPSALAIAEIESGVQLLEDIKTVGVGKGVSMNRASRVKVRAVNCVAEPEQRALCTYEANRCREGESVENLEGWCRRTTRFIRDRHAWQGEPQSRGWIRNPTADHR